MTARQEGSTRLFRGELKKLGLTKHHPFYLAWCNMKTRLLLIAVLRSA